MADDIGIPRDFGATSIEYPDEPIKKDADLLKMISQRNETIYWQKEEIKRLRIRSTSAEFEEFMDRLRYCVRNITSELYTLIGE